MSPAVVVALLFKVASPPSVTAPSVSAVFVVFTVPSTVTVPPTAVVVSPPAKVNASPPPTPSVSAPVFVKFTAAVTVFVVPWKVMANAFASVVRLADAVSPVNVIDPPVWFSASASMPLVEATVFAPLPRIVRLFPPPVIAPAVSVPLPAFNVLAPASVTGPSVSAVLVVFSVPFTVTSPPTAVVCNPPAKVNTSPPPTPSVSAPVFVKFTAAVTVFVVPWKVMANAFASVVSAVSVTSLPKVMLPAEFARSSACPDTVPLSVRVPLPPMRLSVRTVAAPSSDAVPVLVNAMGPPGPVPFRVTASAPMATPLMFNVAPLVTVVPAAVEPSAFAFCAESVPAKIVVKPP